MSNTNPKDQKREPVEIGAEQHFVSDENLLELLRQGREVRKKVQEEFAPLVNITDSDLRFCLS